MTHFVAGDLQVGGAIEHLCQLINHHGGLVRDDLLIESDRSTVTIRAPESIASQARVLAIPKHILLPIDSFQFVLENDQLIFRTHDTDLNPAQVELMQATLDVFNLL